MTVVFTYLAVFIGFVLGWLSCSLFVLRARAEIAAERQARHRDDAAEQRSRR